MSSDLNAAKSLLEGSELTLAAVHGAEVVTSRERGVKPLLELLDSSVTLDGFTAADKVVGKAAAFLYVLLNVREVYARVISQPAMDVLRAHGITVTCDTLTGAIRNRTNTGFCPMETAVMNTDSPEEAVELIREKLVELGIRN